MNDNKADSFEVLKTMYLNSLLLKSFLTGLSFFIFPAYLVKIITNGIANVYPAMRVMMLITSYLSFLLISYFANKIVIVTLKNYGDNSSKFNYKQFLLGLRIKTGLLITLFFMLGIIFTGIKGGI